MFDRNIFGDPTHFLSLTSRSISSSVLAGDNPSAYDPANPITLFIIQLVIIISFTSCLGWAFSFIKQPRVIAEVIGGVILGPTVFGRIPNFSRRIFPHDSLPFLNLVSTIGLILFLFLVGLEVDVSVMKKNGRNSAIISAAGMLLPFGLGAAVAVPVYHNFVDPSTTFGHFLLFVGVAMAITAFPVLCRILTSTKLLDTKVGVIVLAAGVGNDVVGWALILLFPIKWGFRWMARKSGSIDQGSPTPFMMVLTLLVVFSSAFVTDIIGVHPIFGGFIAGLIIPHEGGFAIALVEKIDDLVSMLFLPIYFVLSGLSTNLGLINTGKDWGFVILLCVVAWIGKFVGCAGTAKLLKYSTRESGAIGMLMSCKGLVELIVLNVGLQVGIIDQRLFSMFVVEAVVLTFITTPLTVLIYPERHRSRGSALEKRPTRDVEKEGMAGGLRFGVGAGGRETTTRLLVVLQKIEHLSPVMLLAQMLEPQHIKARQPWSGSGLMTKSASKGSSTVGGGDISEESVESLRDDTGGRLSKSGDQAPMTVARTTGPNLSAVQIDALKLIELTGRTFSVMQSAEKDQLLLTDDALQLFRQFGRLRGLEVTPHISIVGQDSYPNAVADYADNLGTELTILPWTIPPLSGNAPGTLSLSDSDKEATPAAANPSATLSSFEKIFGVETAGSPIYTHFLRRVFTECTTDTALFIDRGFSSGTFSPGAGQHIFMPFYGGPDDRLALRFAVQLCHHSSVTATIVRIIEDVTVDDDDESALVKAGKNGMSESMQVHQNALLSNQLTVGPSAAGPIGESSARLASETADDVAWAYYTAPLPASARSASLTEALSRTAFWTQTTSSPLSYALSTAESSARAMASDSLWRPMMIITGRGRRGAKINHSVELNKSLVEKGQNPSVGAELRKTVGDSATAMILGGGQPAQASLLILEASGR
ncbi:putative potassium:hydrogen antiporter [Kockovaella imperatae]|uniref:Putative potassium:hydrogen antiporter n=1 Tax=Kockovaella imperatae TaxID=4999 RepID=A0A1Y1UMQ3_9TREE|nr:putative potassium:hydrogen antiporter [Kockovaella imperatae]ORX39289.1 putative potassium:hydrogen antiporter [Kockovaella imperatae]